MFRLALVYSLRFSLTVVVVRVVMSSEEMETCVYVCIGAGVRVRKRVGISNECIVTFYLLY